MLRLFVFKGILHECSCVQIHGIAYEVENKSRTGYSIFSPRQKAMIFRPLYLSLVQRTNPLPHDASPTFWDSNRLQFLNYGPTHSVGCSHCLVSFHCCSTQRDRDRRWQALFRFGHRQPRAHRHCIRRNT